MLPFLSRSWKTKTRSQSSEHGVVATGEHGYYSSSFCVEGHVWFLGGPETMEQHCQLARDCNNRLIPGLLPPREARCGPTVEAPSPFHAVGGYGWNTRSADFADRRCQPRRSEP
jgi:hypothetical protein